MTFIPPFLSALELTPEADERAIRRAYAKRLRLIDQEADPVGFQQLREAFEQALRWHALRDRRQLAGAAQRDEAHLPRAATGPLVRPDPARPPPPADVATLAQAQASGEAVFADFARAIASGMVSEGSAAALLARALADERLVNMDAAAWFEFLVAHRLVEGWRPGHEFLFRPACQVFHWEQDRRRLQLHGAVGQVIDSAITERLIFYGQTSLEFTRSADMIRRLRDDAAPGDAEVRTRMALLQSLMQRYPNFVRILAPQANVVAWRARSRALPPPTRIPIGAAGLATGMPLAAPGSPAGRRAPHAATGNGKSGVGWMLSLVVALATLARVFSVEPAATARAPDGGLRLSAEFDDAGSDIARRQKDAERAWAAALARAQPPAARTAPAPLHATTAPPPLELASPPLPSPDPFPLSIEYRPEAPPAK